MEKYLKKKGREAYTQYALIPFTILDSDAFRTLRPASAFVYLRLFRRFHGYNNGYIPFGCREAAIECNIGKMTAQRAFKQLEEVGLIECIVPSSFNSRKKLSREWAFTHRGIGDQPASRKWRNYKLKPSTKIRSSGINRNTHVFDLNNHITR